MSKHRRRHTFLSTTVFASALAGASRASAVILRTRTVLGGRGRGASASRAPRLLGKMVTRGKRRVGVVYISAYRHPGAQASAQATESS